ncbi:MAG: helix-turn-helix domain-containing protein [Bacteroides sp.]|nr:helix-turn-helix domain-containing protein [Bacteroides sp.]
MDIIKLGELIKQRRKSLKIDQRTLALLAGVGLNTVVAVERGDGNPKISTILTLLDTMGLQISITLKD